MKNYIQRNKENSEVEVLGERNFNDTCNIMCNQVDVMYNTNLSLGSTSSSATKENFMSMRVINPSRYYVSPYDMNPTSIKQSEIRNYEAITTLCDIDEFKYKWAVKFDNCKVSVLQLETSMKLNGWVESYVINVLCRKLFKDNHPRQSNKHYFFSTTSNYLIEKWQNKETRLRWKENAIKGLQAANGARALYLSERLYFPSVYTRHWFVFAVDMKARNFLFIDSYYEQQSAYSKKTSNLLIKNFMTLWFEAGLKRIHFEKFGTFYPNVPKQNNGDDCGILLIKYI